MEGLATETVDQTGENVLESVQIIGTTSEAILMGDVTGTAHLLFKNMTPLWSSLTAEVKATYTDEADYKTKNSVYVGTTSPVTSGNAVQALYPGSGMFMTTTVLAWYGIRDTNDVNLLVVAIEV
jgi:hypothetical protein